METKILSFGDTEEITNIIKNDGVIAFPTETVYGLGVKYDSFLAYDKIFELKKRDGNKSLSLMLSNTDDIKKYVDTDDKIERIINKFMPGALTIVLPIKPELDLIGINDFVGIRIPDSEKMRKLLSEIKIPLFMTSANISSQPDCINFDQVKNVFDGQIDAIIKGEVSGEQASTVVKIDNGIQLLRKGPISLEQIEEVFNDE